MSRDARQGTRSAVRRSYGSRDRFDARHRCRGRPPVRRGGRPGRRDRPVELRGDLAGALDGEAADAGDALAWSVWGEWLEVDDADVLAVHGDEGVSAARPAIARNEVGSGGVTYCGVWPDSSLAATLVGDVLGRAGVATVARLPRGVRVNRRGDLTWVSNFTSDAHRVTATGDALDDSAFVVGDADLGAFDAVAVTTPLGSLEVVPRE